MDLVSPRSSFPIYIHPALFPFHYLFGLLTEGDFGAVPDTWPNAMPAFNFNAGVLSLTPSNDTFSKLMDFTASIPLPEDAEQGVLNQFFLLPTPRRVGYPSAYTRTILPMKYNLNLEACRSHMDQWEDIWPDVRIVHYTVAKPGRGDCREGSGCVFEQPMRRWRHEFEEMIQSI